MVGCVFKLFLFVSCQILTVEESLTVINVYDLSTITLMIALTVEYIVVICTDISTVNI